MPTRAAFFRSLVRLDSIRVSNTTRPPVHGALCTPNEIPPMRPAPLGDPGLQNDDSRVRARLLSGRQRDREGGPPPRSAGHVDLPPVRLGDPLADGEAQPPPPPFPPP